MKTTTWMLAAVATMALVGCIDGDGSDDDTNYSQTRVVYAPAATFETQIDACVAGKSCEPLCVAAFKLDSSVQIDSCAIQSRDLAGAMVQLTYTTASSSGGISIGVWVSGDDDGDDGDDGDGSDDGGAGDGSGSGSDDGSMGSDGSDGSVGSDGSDDGSDDGGDDGSDDGRVVPHHAQQAHAAKVTPDAVRAT